jgi:hypothetical protein
MILVVAQGNMSVDIDTPSSRSRTCLRHMKARIFGVVEVVEAAEAAVDPVDVSTSLALLWMDLMARIMATLQIGALNSGCFSGGLKSGSCCELVGQS